MLIFCENTDIYDNFMCDIGLSIRREINVLKNVILFGGIVEKQRIPY
jgi:hypothetical protein